MVMICGDGLVAAASRYGDPPVVPLADGRVGVWAGPGDTDQWFLVVPRQTGVVYATQAGGIACLHPEVEGFVLRCHDIPELADTACRVGCWGEPAWSDAAVEEVDLALAGAGLELDRARLGESYEGWLWVQVEGVGSAVLMGPNCD